MAGNDSPTTDGPGAVAASALELIGDATSDPPVLAESLTTTDGERHEMAGVLPVDVRMCERYQALDHVELRATRDTLTAPNGETVRGHEFHYSAADPASDAAFAFEVERGTGIDGFDGLTEYETLGTYAPVHAESGAFDRFVDRL